MSATRFCGHCQTFKPREGFDLLVTPSGVRRAMCQACQEIRKRPRSELQALADKVKEDRKKK